MAKGFDEEKNEVSFRAEIPRYVGYCDCFLGTKVEFRLENLSGERVKVKLKTGENELFLPFEKEAEIPFDGAISLSADGILSPRFLAENNAPQIVTFRAELICKEEKILQEGKVTALPFDWFEGLGGIIEKVACFVRPRIFQTARVVKEAKRRLAKWGVSDFNGYENADKNVARKAVTAIFSAIKELGFTREGDFDLSSPALASPPSVAAARRADAFRMALFAAACLERAGLHPVLALAKNRIGVGAWLFDSCFLESSFDDDKTVEHYLSDGVNHLAFFDAEDLLIESGASFLNSSQRFLRALKGGKYERFVDITRCRLSGFAPCPTRGAGENGYEIYEENANGAPPPLAEYKPLAHEKLSKNKLWERELLDFSSHNPLLDFKGKGAIEMLVPDADELRKRLQGEGLKITGGGKESVLSYERELLLLEEKKGILRTPLSTSEADAIALKLRRRNKEAFEETGAKVLFLACGFLTYRAGEEQRRAPIVLLPAELERAKGKEGFRLFASGEHFVNLTLAEFLKEEYNLDLRGIENANYSVKEILAIFRKETAFLKEREVSEEVFLSAFSFQRFIMWNDLKEHFSEFKKNRAVRALFAGKTQETPSVPAIDAGTDGDVFLPLPSDASQREAIRLSESGRNFVLQGPPGTGKSQTIANVISLALLRGKSVLFVAEKKAAIEVVKRRLSDIGIGDFCLELNSKADGDEAFKQFERALSMTRERGEGDDFAFCKEYERAKKELSAGAEALFRKRKLSLSVHEAIVRYSERKRYPDALKIDGDFYESLDEEKLSKYAELILSAASAAKECGGVFNSPFENVDLEEYSPAVRDRAILSGRTLLAEAAHLKGVLSLVLDFFKQKVSVFTQEKARTLAEILKGLLSGKYSIYFKDATAEEFLSFRRNELLLTSRLAFYEKHFKLLVNPEREADALKEWISSGGGRLNNAALSIKKRLERVALHPLSEKDVPKYIEAVLDVFEARKKIAESPFFKYLSGRGGRISKKKLAAFLAPLKELSAACSSVFSVWSPEHFFDGCIRAESGCAELLFSSYLAATEGFFRAEEGYLSATGAKRERTRGEDIIAYFSAKAAALLENADLLSGRCAYKRAEGELSKRGMKFIGDALERGALSPDDALGGFEKSLLERFLLVNVSSDPFLSRMTSEGAECENEKFALLAKRQIEFARRRLKETLIDRLPKSGEFQEELSLLFRLGKGTRRGRLRNLLSNAPALVKRICPCLLLSPDAAAQYLVPRADEYDLVIFDEASQMTTAEAIPALARAKQAIVAGDDRQLSPTSFFRTAFSEEDEGERLESVLDESLAAGFEERSLLWHYRSRHESLIAFSNATYYENRLNVVPSPIVCESKVKAVNVGGTYDRGGTKRNKKEAEALVQEVIRRLQDCELARYSIGVVTFSSVQREEIERILAREISKRSLEEVAYGKREPLFVKNLESVQGDERDVILFSVCYGKDGEGKLSLNFGALNRAGGWRRLNVACSRAREEMIVFSSISSSDIDLSRTSSQGVAGLKAFLEFAEKGRVTLPLSGENAKREGIGRYLAKELCAYGYECRTGVGASNFKIDVAVVDPKNEKRYLLGILSDRERGDAADGAALLPSILKRAGWNLLFVSSVAFFNNPSREIKRIKDCLDRLTGKKEEGGLSRYSKPYRHVKDTGGKTAAFVTDGKNDEEIARRLKEIVGKEEPISRAFLKRRCLESFGIVRAGLGAQSRLDELILRSAFPVERVEGREYFYKHPKALLPLSFRREGRAKRRRKEEDFTPFETAAMIKGILEEEVALYEDELISRVAFEYGAPLAEGFSSVVSNALSFGESKGMFYRSFSGRISLAETIAKSEK